MVQMSSILCKLCIDILFSKKNVATPISSNDLIEQNAEQEDIQIEYICSYFLFYM